MFREGTVFVLGAGASVPYRFPTGAGLRNEILIINERHGDPRWEGLKDAGISPSKYSRFAMAFLHSGLASIDRFVAERPEYRDEAEMAIAAVLLPLELEHHLYYGPTGGVYSDWYGYLWNEMIAGTSGLDHVLERAPKFITFNYDRSLEYFLLAAIQNTYAKNHVEGLDCLARLEIHHVYGALGELDRDDSIDPFGYGRTSSKGLELAVKNIKTVPLARNEPCEVHERAASLLRGAKRIIALGFAFDAMNCERIGLKAANDACRVQEFVFATGYGLTAGEMNSINARNRGGGPGFTWGRPIDTSIDLLRLMADHLLE